MFHNHMSGWFHSAPDSSSSPFSPSDMSSCMWSNTNACVEVLSMLILTVSVSLSASAIRLKWLRVCQAQYRTKAPSISLSPTSMLESSTPARTSELRALHNLGTTAADPCTNTHTQAETRMKCVYAGVQVWAFSVYCFSGLFGVSGRWCILVIWNLRKEPYLLRWREECMVCTGIRTDISH